MKLLKCESCDIYTLKITCPTCGKKTIEKKPPRLSPKKDKILGKYRQKLKSSEI